MGGPNGIPDGQLTQISGARWLSSGPLSRNVSVLKVKCPWKTGGRESGHEPCSQTPTNEPQQQQERQL
jgi:hypothetical protein